LKYSKKRLNKLLCDEYKELSVFTFEKIGSTNSFLKEFEEKNQNKKDALAVANEQSAGRGTRGRSFISRRGGGLYMSILFHPEKSVRASDITVYAAVVISEALEKCAPISLKIKWVNDLYLADKKLAGILTEGQILEDGSLSYAILGVGINTHGYTLPAEISDIATTVERECGEKIDRVMLCAEITNSFFGRISEIGSKSIIDEYKKRSLIVGREVFVLSGNDKFTAIVVDILDTGAILVEKDDKTLTILQSADVSLKLK
jgi:BirA family biotin operon repressor/biotin-[acetyl-CoA-carboxylase] ligase